MAPAREDPEYDIVVCIGPKDLEVAKMCLSTIQKHVQYGSSTGFHTVDIASIPGDPQIRRRRRIGVH